MKVRLLNRVPVEPKHGMAEGRVLEVVEPPADEGGTWVVGDTGEKVRLHEYEYAEVK